jgi:hypothetical protein
MCIILRLKLLLHMDRACGTSPASRGLGVELSPLSLIISPPPPWRPRVLIWKGPASPCLWPLATSAKNGDAQSGQRWSRMYAQAVLELRCTGLFLQKGDTVRPCNNHERGQSRDQTPQGGQHRGVRWWSKEAISTPCRERFEGVAHACICRSSPRTEQRLCL